ncbi:hypothetical protein G6F52_014009 [Rhizopus delemar]|nr:hypothetical protein G6F52_014009 [Rhizopus delemar]
MDAGVVGARYRCTGTCTPQCLHRAVPHHAGADAVHGCRRPVPRLGQRRAQGGGLHELLHVFAVGHLPCTASVAYPGPAGEAQHRLRQFHARPP